MKKRKSGTIIPEWIICPISVKNGILKSIMLFLAIWVGVSALAQTFTYEGVNYTVLTETTCKTADGSFQCETMGAPLYNTTRGNNCSGNLTIPAEVEYNGNKYAVTEIGISSFAKNDIQRVVLPNCIQKINDGAFYDCQLEYIDLPNGLKSIGEAAITSLSMNYVLIPPSVTNFYEGDYMYNGKTHNKKSAITGCHGILYPRGLIKKSYMYDLQATYPEGAHLSEDGWIYDDNGGYYNVPLSMGKIGAVPDECVSFNWNFSLSPYVKLFDLKNVHKVNISAKGEATLTFDYELSNHASIAYMNYIRKPVSNCTFFLQGEDQYCTYVSIEGNSETRLFKTGKATRIEDIYAGTTQITDYAFQNNDLLTEVVIPEGINLLEGQVFEGCTNLKKVELPSSLKKTYYNKNNDSFTPFNRCYNLEELIIKEGPTLICGFFHCSKIEKVFLPKTVKSVEHAFDANENMREVETYANYISYSFGNITDTPLKIRMLSEERATIKNSFSSTLAEWYIYSDVPETYLSEQYANFDKYYNNCKLVVKEEYLDNYINDNVFGRMKTICADGKEYPIFDDDHFLYRFNPVKDEAILLGAKNSIQTATIPRRIVVEDNEESRFVNVKSIFYRAFEDDTQLRKVSLGTGIENIGERAFSGCKNLEEFEFPSTLRTIGDFAFSGDTCLVVTSLPNEIKDISRYAFSSCLNLKTLQMPASLDSIGQGAFSGCSRLEEIKFNEGLRIIDSGAFEKTGLVDVKLPESLELLYERAFSNCTDLKSVVIGSNCSLTPQYSNTYQFNNCTNLKSVVISDGTKPIEIDKYVFNGVTGIENFHLGRNLIGNTSYFTLPNIKTFTIGNSVERFYGGIEEVELYSLVGLGYSLETLILGSNIQAIPDGFCDNTNLKKVLIPSSVKTIGWRAFSNCKLTDIYMGSTLTDIHDYAFYGNDDLEKIYITAQVPPEANNNVFSAYTATLYTPSKSKGSYVDYPKCWYRFENQIEGLIEPSELKITVPKVQELKPGATIDLSATVYPTDTTIPTVFWSSSNPELATVDHNGKVTVKGWGKISTSGDKQSKPGKSAEREKVVITASTLYAAGPIAQCEISLNKELGIIEIPAVGDSDRNGTVDYTQPYDVYNLSGLKVAETVTNLAKGIYIIKQNGNAEKMMIP